jgi:hypothetical protein
MQALVGSAVDYAATALDVAVLAVQGRGAGHRMPIEFKFKSGPRVPARIAR